MSLCVALLGVALCGCPLAAVAPPGSGADTSHEPGDGPAGGDGSEDDPSPEPDDTSGGTNTTTMPANAYCAAVSEWSSDWDTWEAEVLALVNARRSEGATCGANGSFDAAGPLTMNGALRCAARNHSMDMAERDYFSHSDPDGRGPGTRIELAEYDWRTWGENIAYGYATPESVVAGWMSSDGHCANIMNPSFTEIGVGYYEGSLWTQVFGAPR